MRSGIFLFSVFLLCLSVSEAYALPSFARQTGQECAACHVGSFGPQLTPYGRDFKLNGYVWGDIKNKLNNLAGMVFGGFEHTKKDLNKNDHLAVDQASIFYAGELAPYVGIFSQATYSGADDAYAWDNVDIRYANNTMLGGKDFVYGATLNNSPSVQDIWQTSPAWGFPYLESGLASTPDAEPYMAGLGQTVAGIGGYSMWDRFLYTELSGYRTLSDGTQRTFGVSGVSGSDHLRGIAPYWRVAVQHNFGQHYVSLGTFGMYSKRYPGNDHSEGTDSMLDSAIDATWQYAPGDGKHSFSLYGSALHERQDMKATKALRASTNTGNSLNSYRTNASYYYKNAYGATLGRFVLKGSSDLLLYPDPANHRPDSAGWTVQFDMTPFGTEQSAGWPYLNARFFVQYTAYDKFNGLSKNYDGAGRNASDNNTLFLGTWMAF